MTLTELLPAIRQLPEADKAELIRILVAKLDANQEDIALLETFKTYELPTPSMLLDLRRL